jgi:hypothetical protein
MAQLIKTIFWNPAIYSVSTPEGTKFSLHRGAIAARALIAGGAVFALASRALPERYSRLFPCAAAGVSALAMGLLAASGGKKEIQARNLDIFLKNPSNPSTAVKTYLESKEFETFMGDKETVWTRLCSCSGKLQENALFKRVVLTVYNAFSQSEKHKAFEQSISAVHTNAFHALLASPAELHMPSSHISLEAALLLKQRGLDVKPAERQARNGNEYAYCYNDQNIPVLHAGCVNTLLALSTERFQQIYPRLLVSEKFWDQPNDGLFDLGDDAVVQSLWNSALQRCYRSKNGDSLLCDVLRKRWTHPFPWGDLIGEEVLNTRVYINRSMICTLVQHKILTPDQISDNDLVVLWTDPLFIDVETAALLKEHKFSPNVKVEKKSLPLRSVLFQKYNNVTWHEELHLKALLDAGATYSKSIQSEFSERDEKLGKLFDQYPEQLKTE